MKSENKHFPLVISRLRHINLLNYCAEEEGEKYPGNLKKQLSDDFEDNVLVKFIEITFSMAKSS